MKKIRYYNVYSRSWILIAFFCFWLLFQGIMSNIHAKQEKKSILIVYHVGEPPWRSSPELGKKNVEALSQATTRNINTEIISRVMKTAFTSMGYRVFIKKAADIREPVEYLKYDGIIFGSPNWFSNMAYPIKKLFDEHFIRIWDHRRGRLNDKVLAGFVAAMSDESGDYCLKGINWVLEQMSPHLVKGIVINVRWSLKKTNTELNHFCQRFNNKLREVHQ